jgi:hypothetical protein
MQLIASRYLLLKSIDLNIFLCRKHLLVKNLRPIMFGVSRISCFENMNNFIDSKKCHKYFTFWSIKLVVRLFPANNHIQAV